jgi:CheY-like chemotaxis protein
VTRRLCEDILSAESDTLLLVRLGELRPRIQFLAQSSAIAYSRRLRLLIDLCDALASDLLARSVPLVKSSLYSLVTGVKLAGELAEHEERTLNSSWPPSILIIDPDMVTSRWASAILRRAQMETWVAQTIDEGLKLLAETPFDLVAIDVGSCGDQGPDLPARIRQLEPHHHTPLLCLTTDAVGSPNPGQDDRPVEWVKKPISASELGVKVATLLAAGMDE